MSQKFGDSLVTNLKTHPWRVSQFYAKRATIEDTAVQNNQQRSQGALKFATFWTGLI